MPIYGELHICDEDGEEVAVGEEGQIYFGGTAPPNYHNAPEKTKGALQPETCGLVLARRCRQD